MEMFELFAQAFRYPFPGQMESLYMKVVASQDFLGKNAFVKFAEELKKLSINEQEELYTRTLDLSPLTAPYVGYQVWGESYKRGEFMAMLNKEMKDHQIDLEGELPDHLVPILDYLQTATSPVPELIGILDQALNSMIKSLKKEEKDNPYIFLFEALAFSFGAIKIEA